MFKRGNLFFVRTRERDRSKTGLIRRNRRESNSKLWTTDYQSSEIKSSDDEHNSSAILESSGILKASLTIPTSSFALNLDDSDIPFIEDNNNLTEGSKHQLSFSK